MSRINLLFFCTYKGGIKISTRSRIGIIKKDGTIKSIYCHHDGYLDYVGKMLNNNYSNYDDVKELINLGDISSLREKIKPDNNQIHSFDQPQENVTIAYHRDRDEDWNNTKPKTNKNLDDFNKDLEDSWIEYIYLYDEKNNKWLWDFVDYDNNKIELKDLSKELKKIERVAIKTNNTYGIFCIDDIPFFNELYKTKNQIAYNYELIDVYESTDYEVEKKIIDLINKDISSDDPELEIKI